MSKVPTIAIVDDHAMFRKGLAALIGLFPGHEVLFDAGGGEGCIRQLEAGRIPDVLLMDIVMPGMDGYAVTSWVRDHFPQVKVLALSTMDAETAILRMIRSGAKGYLLKDADPEDLKRAFEEVISLGYYCNELVSRKIVRAVHLSTEGQDRDAMTVRLSDRELNFLQLVCSEKTYGDIAREMFVSERTVDGYRDSLFKKLGLTSRVGLVLYAIRNGIFKV
jgi:DNA-binding NarL/FixJ family response regulator